MSELLSSPLKKEPASERAPRFNPGDSVFCYTKKKTQNRTVYTILPGQVIFSESERCGIRPTSLAADQNEAVMNPTEVACLTKNIEDLKKILNNYPTFYQGLADRQKNVYPQPEIINQALFGITTDQKLNPDQLQVIQQVFLFEAAEAIALLSNFEAYTAKMKMPDYCLIQLTAIDEWSDKETTDQNTIQLVREKLLTIIGYDLVLKTLTSNP